ncbi:MAG TPA: hypothetical protein VIW03_13845 [Anaeromyxobacter sp.]
MRPAILVLALAFACGGGPVPGTPGGEAGGGPGDGSGGGGTGGGSGGGGPAGAGTTSVTFERGDESGDCAGLLPDRAPAPVAVRRSAPAGATCVGGTSDGTGAVAVGVRDGSGATSWQAFSPDGTALAVFAADAPLLPQPSGWHAVVASGPQGASAPKVELLSVSPGGNVAHRETVSPDPSVAVYVRWNLAADPAGGSLVALRSSALAGNHWSSVASQRFDAAGIPLWPGGVKVRIVPSSTEPIFLAGGVCTGGQALVVSQHSAWLDVSWLDARTGAAIPGSGADQAERSSDVVGDGFPPDVRLVPLLDGSLAVRAEGTFRRVYPRLATTTAPLPAWLADRASFTFRFTRGNAGYAAFPPPGQASADCTQRIDLVSPSGRLCGRVVLREDGSSCTTGAVDQGWDGTVVQQSGKDGCTHRFWPRLLAR